MANIAHIDEFDAWWEQYNHRAVNDYYTLGPMAAIKKAAQEAWAKAEDNCNEI